MICALLRGEDAPWLSTSDAGALPEVLLAARCHGVMPLLHAKFVQRALQETWPAAIRRACHEDAIAQAVHELAHRAELTRVLTALTTAGIGPLILKGTALAYSHYPNPAMRPRGDTDLLVPPDATATVARVFYDLGYGGQHDAGGTHASHQSTWSRTDQWGKDHHFDVHWRISNSAILAKALGYEELAPRARALLALGPHARALAAVDALLFACMHRAGHAGVPYRSGDDVLVGGDRLIWLYDIHLLLTAMSTAELHEFASLAAEKRLRTICLDALRKTRACFGTPTPQDVLDALEPRGATEPSARFVTGGRGQQMLGDFLAIVGWPARLQFLREIGFPAPDYMRRKYPNVTIRWLPALYVRRAFGSLGKLLPPGGAGRRL